MTTQTFATHLTQDDGSVACGIQLPFNPKDVYGRVRAPVRAPVRATINGFTFRTTTCSMSGAYWIPVNKGNREAAGISAGDKIKVRLELDTDPRVIKPPVDLAKALKADPAAQAAWKKLSYTHQKEHAHAVEEAKRPETRQRRIAKTIKSLGTVNKHN